MEESGQSQKFIIKRIEKALAANELRHAFELLHLLDPLPGIFNTVLRKVDEEEFENNEAYRSRLAQKINWCLDKLIFGYYGAENPSDH